MADINIYQHQVEAVINRHKEVLLSGDGGGKSFALRAGAIMLCIEPTGKAGTKVALVHPRADELTRDHVEGKNGLKALLADKPGAARFDQGSIQFKNGSEIILVGADKVAQVRRLTEDGIKTIMIDDAHRLPRELYDQITTRAKLSRARVISASPPLESAGWIAQRFALTSPDRTVISFDQHLLPEDLRVASSMPTLGTFMDGLGVPFLSSDSRYRQK